MKTYSTRDRVGRENVDAALHFNNEEQLRVANAHHAKQRKLLGIDLDYLRNQHGLYLVVRKTIIGYTEQLRLGETFNVQITTWIPLRSARLCYHCIFLNTEGAVAGSVTQSMVLVEYKNGSTGNNPLRLRSVIIDAVGTDVPDNIDPDLLLALMSK